MKVKNKKTIKKLNCITPSRVGQVHRAETKFIEKDTKRTRRYVIVKDNNFNIGVSKTNSIKKFTENGRNADKALIEIDNNYPGLTKRTGVDFKVHTKNRITKQRLQLKKEHGFNPLPEFKLNAKDMARVKSHVHIRGGKRKRK